MLADLSQQVVKLTAARSADRHNGGKREAACHVGEQWEELRFILALVDLVDCQHDRPVFRQQIDDAFVACVEVIGVHDEDHHINLGQRLLDAAIHRSVERVGVLRLETRRIDEDELRVRPRQNAHDAMTCRLCLARDDTDLFANQAVEQRRFSNVWATDDGDGAGFELGHDF